MFRVYNPSPPRRRHLLPQSSVTLRSRHQQINYLFYRLFNLSSLSIQKIKTRNYALRTYKQTALQLATHLQMRTHMHRWLFDGLSLCGQCVFVLVCVRECACAKCKNTPEMTMHRVTCHAPIGLRVLASKMKNTNMSPLPTLTPGGAASCTWRCNVKHTNTHTHTHTHKKTHIPQRIAQQTNQTNMRPHSHACELSACPDEKQKKQTRTLEKTNHQHSKSKPSPLQHT